MVIALLSVIFGIIYYFLVFAEFSYNKINSAVKSFNTVNYASVPAFSNVEQPQTKNLEPINSKFNVFPVNSAVPGMQNNICVYSTYCVYPQSNIITPLF